MYKLNQNFIITGEIDINDEFKMEEEPGVSYI